MLRDLKLNQFILNINKVEFNHSLVDVSKSLIIETFVNKLDSIDDGRMCDILNMDFHKKVAYKCFHLEALDKYSKSEIDLRRNDNNEFFLVMDDGSEINTEGLTTREQAISFLVARDVSLEIIRMLKLK